MKTQHTFSLTFFLKKDKQTKGNAPLFVKITINGTPARLSTKKRIAIDHWNQKEQKSPPKPITTAPSKKKYAH